MKIFIAALFTLPAFLLSGQEALTLGNSVLGGGISFSLNESEDAIPAIDPTQIDEDRSYQRFSYSFSPYYGRFYDDFKMVGVRLNVRRDYQENVFRNGNAESIREFVNFSYGVGIFLRQYFPYSERFGVFLQSGLDLSRAINRDNRTAFSISPDSVITLSQDERENGTFGGSAYSEVGLYFFILDRLSLETRLARFFLSYNDRKFEERGVSNGSIQEGDGNNTNLDFRFINTFTFDQIFTINYYF